MSSLFALGTRVADARGNAVRLIDLANPKQLVPGWCDLPMRDQRQVLSCVPRPWWMIVYSLSMTLFTGAMCFSTLSRTLSSPGGLLRSASASPFMWALNAGMVVVVVYMWMRGHLWGERSREVVRGFLEIRRCPSCAQELGGLPRAEDGCTVCAECGAAWRVGGR